MDPTLEISAARPSVSTDCSICFKRPKQRRQRREPSPFDLIRVDDNHFQIKIAVAGFKADDLEVTAQQSVLVIRGDRSEPITMNELSD